MLKRKEKGVVITFYFYDETGRPMARVEVKDSPSLIPWGSERILRKILDENPELEKSYSSVFPVWSKGHWA